MTDLVTFVMVVSNSMPHIQATISSLYQSTNYPFTLIIVESESTDGTQEYLDHLATIHNNIKIIHTKKEGTVKAFNVGIRATEKGSHVFLCHDDVYFFKWYMKDWLDICMNTLKNNPKMGLLIPMSGGGISGPDYVDGLFWAGTWSTLIRNEVIEKFGKEMFLDENFGKGFGDDIDMTYRTLKLGYTLCRLEFWIDHHRLSEHKYESNPDAEEIKKKNALYFRKKHDLIPVGVAQ